MVELEHHRKSEHAVLNERKPVIPNFNPRTDGGPGHLSTDGGADNRPPPPGDLENEAS